MFFLLYFMMLSSVLAIVHHSLMKIVQKSTKLSLKNVILLILVAILDFWPPSRFEGKFKGAQERFSNSVV